MVDKRVENGYQVKYHLLIERYNGSTTLNSLSLTLKISVWNNFVYQVRSVKQLRYRKLGNDEWK